MSLFIKQLTFFAFLFLFSSVALGEVKTIHVFVALCDNENQGIVPVPGLIGNGQDPSNNLYWGAAYGVKNFFKNKSKEWRYIKAIPSNNKMILERILFKHKTEDVYLLADAYDGRYIKECTEDFLMASNCQNLEMIELEDLLLNFGGEANLLSYVGHDGLMEFSVDLEYDVSKQKRPDVIILACYSEDFFDREIRQSGANPILWTTHLMAPEAYTLKAAIDGWVRNETGEQIKGRGASAYCKYQKCSDSWANRLFTTGLDSEY